MLRGRFRGAVVGSLVGDCLGAYWERKSWKGVHSLSLVKETIASQVGDALSKKGPLISYTDDTALTLALGESLVECGGFDSTHFAKRITEVYYEDPRRGYGSSVSSVFTKLKTTEFSDVFAPATEQFKGEGSCGNGSAMRISPAALFGFNDDKLLVEVCRDSSRVTHSHPSAVNNAILQAAAIKVAFRTEVGKLEPVQFIDTLTELMRPHEHCDLYDKFENKSKPATKGTSKVEVDYMKGQVTCLSRLCQIKELLQREDSPTAFQVQDLLGHGVLAAEAVPCAIYAFVSHCKKSFQEMIPYAISLGGDTDTIASMAGAIGGAYWGYDCIPRDWIEACEEPSRCCALADSLHDMLDKTVSVAKNP